MYCINGYFLSQPVTGIQRVAHRLTQELDKRMKPGELYMAIPSGVAMPPLKNIRVEQVPGHGFLWEQWAYPRYLKQHGLAPLCLCNVLPLLWPYGIVFIHDVSYRANPQYFKGIRSRLSAWWHRLQYRAAEKHAESILTISDFSRTELEHYYPGARGRDHVIRLGWQHIAEVPADETWSQRFPQLKAENYYLMLATVAENKNFSWVWRQARRCPDETFALIGGGDFNGYMKAKGMEPLPNLFFLGYLSDSMSKALMQHCKAFLFPTYYEGFGLPPLEAMSCGAPVIVSDTPCMHEILGDGAAYINPDATDPLPPFAPREAAEQTLARYSWEKAGQEIANFLRTRKL